MCFRKSRMDGRQELGKVLVGRGEGVGAVERRPDKEGWWRSIRSGELGRAYKWDLWEKKGQDDGKDR